MDYLLLAVIVAFAAIVIGVGAYKRYKKKASLLQASLDAVTPEVTPTPTGEVK